MVILASTRTRKFFSAKLLSRQSAFSVSWCIGLSPSQGENFAFPFTELHEFFPNQFYQSVQNVLNGRDVSVIPPSFVLYANLLRMHSFHSLGHFGLSVSHGGAPLVTGLQLDFVPLFTILFTSISVFSSPQCPFI